VTAAASDSPIVQEIAQLHDGHIDILGTPDGTTGTLLRVSFSQRADDSRPCAEFPQVVSKESAP